MWLPSMGESRSLRCCSMQVRTWMVSTSTRAHRSMWLPYAISHGLALLGGLAGLRGGLPGTGIGALLTLLAAYWFFGEPSFRDSLLHHILPQGLSQNVVGVIPARQIVHRRVVLVSHLDTQRTPWFFATPPALALFMASVYISFGGIVLQAGQDSLAQFQSSALVLDGIQISRKSSIWVLN